MWDLQLRIFVAGIAATFARRIGRFVSANSLTALALASGLLAAALTATGWQYCGLLCWALNRLLDGLDGAVAREFSQQSDFGGYFDIVSDFLVYAALPCALQPACLPLLLAAYIINCASLFNLSAVLERVQTSEKFTSVEMPPALVEGAETLSVYTLALCFPESSVVTTQNLVFSVFAAAVLLSALQRVLWASKHITNYQT